MIRKRYDRPLRKEQQEIFCREMASGSKVVDAYVTAGYPRNSVSAAKMHGKVHIKKRIAYLQERHMERHDVTVDTLLIELEDARKSGKKWRQSGTMVQATLAKAKLLGMLETKVRVMNPEEVTDFSGLSEDELVTLRELAAKSTRRLNPREVAAAGYSRN